MNLDDIKKMLLEDSPKGTLLNAGIVAFLVFLLLFIFFFIYLPITTKHGESITVPDLVGMKLSEVESFLAERDLRYVVSDSGYEANRPPFAVLTQYPPKDSKVKINRKIYLTVNSSKPPIVKLPDIIDSSVKNAQMILESIGLKIGKIKYVPDLAANAVLKLKVNNVEIDKKAVRQGYQVPKGSVIDLVVGDGLGETTLDIPNLIGKPFDEAEVEMIGIGLSVGNIQYDASSSKPAGTIIRQKPEYVKGEKIKVGDIIDLWLAGSPD